MDVLVIALVVTGVALLVAEAHVASFGVLGTAGIAALATAFVLAADAAGIGLGLAVSRSLAENNGGSLTLADGDRGARFTLALPLHPPAEAA